VEKTLIEIFRAYAAQKNKQLLTKTRTTPRANPRIRTRYSRNPFSVVTPLMTCLSVAKALIACSALLLFHGTPPYLK
jgi:hypothetical protein